jgi:hypothetical protein
MGCGAVRVALEANEVLRRGRFGPRIVDISLSWVRAARAKDFPKLYIAAAAAAPANPSRTPTTSSRRRRRRRRPTFIVSPLLQRRL